MHPLIVKIIGAGPKTQNTASENPGDGQKKPPADWWSIGVAGGTLVVLVLQLAAFVIQAHRLGQTIQVMKDTARTQLWAYVAIGPVSIEEHKPKDGMYGIKITIRTGQTPAKNVRMQSVTSSFLPFPLEPHFQFPILNKSLSVINIGAGREQSMIAWTLQPLNANEIALMKTTGGTQKLYAYGTVTYEDFSGTIGILIFASAPMSTETGRA